MSLALGTRVGPYETLAKLGEGGMGEVYRAHDTKLNRDVAIKILPDLFAADPDRLARFQREAHVLAALNHPNIAQIYGFEDSPHARALVMELVDGDDLSQRIAHGPIPQDEALAIARQIAEALEAAHDHGIVHRDLKPANIKVRADGAVKVLDFGLAKALDVGSGGSGGSGGDRVLNSPTITTPAFTQLGVILGTAAYMAPEQARGKAIDKRADIWAFGVILYEMLTGVRLFDGETISDTMAAVLTRPIDLNLIASMNPRVRELVARCLERDAKRRLRDIGEARVALDASAASLSGISTVPPIDLAPRRHRALTVLPWVVAALTTATAIGLVVQRRTPAAAAPSIEVELSAPQGTDFQIGSNAGHVLISPDGTKVVFQARSSRGVALWLRSLDRDEARELPGTTNGFYPFWSPDNLKLGFFANGKLLTVDVAGGLPNAIADAALGRGGSWSEAGYILFTPRGGGTVHRVAETGGPVAQVTKLDLERGENAHYWPVSLPGGSSFLFFVRSSRSGNNGVYFAKADGSGPPTRVLTSLSSALFVPAHDDQPDRLLWVRGTDLLAQAFDAREGRLEGPVIEIARDVLAEESQRGVFASVSRDGTLIWASAKASAVQFAWYDRTGRRGELLPIEPGSLMQPSISPDGKKLAFTRTVDGAGDVWLFEFESGALTRVSTSADYDEVPQWSPDGRLLAYQSVDGNNNIASVATIDGSAPTRLIGRGVDVDGPMFSVDGKHLIFGTFSANTADDLYAIPLDATDAAKSVVRLTSQAGSEVAQHISPDGQWLAFVTTRSAQSEVVLARLTSVDGRPQLSSQWISVAQGTIAHWRRDGGELVYRTEDGQVMAIPTTITDASVRLGKPTALFKLPAVATGRSFDLGPTPDHSRFLVLETPDATRQTVRVLTNWETRLGGARR